MARFTVQFDDEIEKILSDLAKTRKTTKAEILRRALASYSFLDKERQNKKKIVKNEPSLNDLDSSLFSLATLIRKQRNELGHPQEYVIEISRDKAFMFFVLFPVPGLPLDKVLN